MIRYIESLADACERPPLRFDLGVIERYTIPLVLEMRFFLVEKRDGVDVWTVFRFDDDVLVVDFFRNEPVANRFGRSSVTTPNVLSYAEPASPPLYTIEIESGRSVIEARYERGTLRHPIVDGCFLVEGPAYFSNRAEEGVGVPVGVYMSRDYKLRVGLDLPTAFKEQFLTGRHEGDAVI